MTHMRPGTRIKFWSPKYLHQPDVAAPGLLRLLAGIAMFSVTGVPVYAVLLAVSGSTVDPGEGLYVAILHFVLPLGLFYTVNGNHPLSRPIITAYFIVLCAATYLGKGFLGRLELDEVVKGAASIVVLVVVLLWLYRSPKMRLYYALISGQEVPPELEGRRDELATTDWLGHRGKAILSSFLNNMETIVLVGFIVAVFLALMMTG